MRDVWLTSSEFEKEYSPEKYEIIPIVIFEEGNIDFALQKISKISVKLHGLNIEGDLITISGFSKITKTIIVRSKTRRKATMRAKYVRSYRDVRLPLALFLAVERERFTEREINDIKSKINEILKNLKLK